MTTLLTYVQLVRCVCDLHVIICARCNWDSLKF